MGLWLFCVPANRAHPKLDSANINNWLNNSHFKIFFHFNGGTFKSGTFKTLLHWILVGFHNRTPTQRVFINQNSSKSFKIDCGVPQDSYSGLGPILFIIYLGDSTSLRTTYLVSICMQMIFSCICPSCHSRHLLNMMHSSEQSKIQSSTSGPSPWPSNVVYRS